MFNPFKIFKKKKEFPIEENQLPIQQDIQLQRDFSNIDKEDLILSKLETINAKLDNIDQRLRKIEEIANS